MDFGSGLQGAGDVDLLGKSLTIFKQQPHLLKFWDELSEAERIHLIEQYKTFDVDDALQCFKDSARPVELSGLQSIEEERYTVAGKLSSAHLLRYFNIGLQAIAEGKVAAVVLAGGQATRLGAKVPKGMISLGIENCNSLFSLQAARIARLQRLAKKAFPQHCCTIQWIVMTSEATETETLQHLRKIVTKFGLTMDQVSVFNQGEMPCFDLNGDFMLYEKGKIAVAPNGNGGFYAAIKPYLVKFLSMGLQYFHVYCVDNILCRVADPQFIGFCIEKKADCAAKAVEKIDPDEAVGVICRVRGQVKVVEYSELDPELARKRIPDGRLMFRAGNIANHFFTIEFLQQVCSEECRLQFHRALKKIPYVNSDGVIIKPEKPNGIKLEQFVFDVFQYSKNFYVWDVCRESEFSPLKNADSAKKDCLSTCKRDLIAEHRRWLQSVGAFVGNDAVVFIHPLISYAGEGLEGYKGKTLSSPVILLPKQDKATEL